MRGGLNWVCALGAATAMCWVVETEAASVGVRTAALEPAAWAANAWISAADAPVEEGVVGETTPAAPGTSWFVCARTNEGAVVSATWMTTGLGVYELYVNGRRIGTDVLKPGFTDWRKTKYAFTYDVTAAFRRAPGETLVVDFGQNAAAFRPSRRARNTART